MSKYGYGLLGFLGATLLVLWGWLTHVVAVHLAIDIPITVYRSYGTTIEVVNHYDPGVIALTALISVGMLITAMVLWASVAQFLSFWDKDV